MHLHDKRRPRRFSDFRGQKTAVRQVSELVKRQKNAQPLVLSGPPGLGKTSLSLVFGNAMVCTANESDGSPCLVCEACVHFGSRGGSFFHYDVPAHGDDRERLESVLHELNETLTSGHRFLFFDEAHAFSRKAADILLEAIDERKKGIVWCFATTELDALTPALSSRLLSVRLRPLPPAESIQLLQEVCAEENLSFEPDALALIAGLGSGQPRDLLKILGQVAEYADGAVMTASLVERILGFDAREGLMRYLMALADGDVSQQTHAIRSWTGDIEDLLRYTMCFIISAYYNDIMGQELVVDGIVHAMQSERHQIIRVLRSRARVSANHELTPLFEALLDVVANPRIPDDATDCHLLLMKMHTAIARAVSATVVPNAPAQPTPVAPRNEEQNSSVFVAPDSSDRAEVAWEGFGAFFDADTACELINRASMLVQESGRGFDNFVALELGRHHKIEDARRVGDDILQRLATACGGQNSAASYLSYLRRSGPSSALLIASRIPTPSRFAYAAWVETSGVRVTQRIQARQPTDPSLTFHWRCLKEMLVDVPSEAGNWERSRALSKPLRALLKLGPPPPLPQPTAVRGGLFKSSSDLGPRARERLVGEKLACLSAVDDEAWDYVFTGWELREAEIRRAIRARRANALSTLNALHGSSDVGNLERARMIADWPDDPKSWARGNLKTWWGE